VLRVIGSWSVNARVAGIALVAAATLLPGCVRDVTSVDQILWEAMLAGTEVQPTATGSAAAISLARSTETGIAVTGITDGTYRWEIRGGSCAQPGDLVGAETQYPPLVVQAGEASVDRVVVSGRMEASQSYHVAVRDGDPGRVVACGQFVSWE
jgi:hypothetical protein